MSGYTACACRDCMDIAISSVYNGRRLQPVLCQDCEDAGCVNADVNMDGYQYDCQRDDAYGGA
jgi:hypothetical protein